jgi:hypothetical protein
MQPRPRLDAGVRGAPLGLVAVEVSADLRGAGTEPADEGRQLGQLTGGPVESEPVCRDHGPELGVGGDRRVADAVDRGEAVAHPHRVQSPPGPFGEDASGKVLGVFAAARDVTGQMRAQREAGERVAELERFQKLTVGGELKMIELKKQSEYLQKLVSNERDEPDGQA